MSSAAAHASTHTVAVAPSPNAEAEGQPSLSAVLHLLQSLQSAQGPLCAHSGCRNVSRVICGKHVNNSACCDRPICLMHARNYDLHNQTIVTCSHHWPANATNAATPGQQCCAAQ